MAVFEYMNVAPSSEGSVKDPSEILASDEKKKESGSKAEESGSTPEGDERTQSAGEQKTSVEKPLKGGVSETKGEGSADSEWKIQVDKGTSEEDVHAAGAESDGEDTDEEVEKPRRSLLDKFRNKPVLLVPVGGIAIAVWMFASAVMGGSAPVENVTESSEDVKDGFPVVEPPEVRKEPFTNYEVEKMLNESVKDAARIQIGRMNSNSAGTASGEHEVKKTRGSKKRRASFGPKRKKKSRQKKRKRNSVAVERGDNPVLDETSATTDLDAAPRRPRPPRGAGFYKAGVTISASAGKKKGGNTLIPPGTSFLARLKVGVSTDFAGATVLAEVLETVGDGKSVFLPKGSLIKGRMRGTGDRIYIDFHTAVAGGRKTTLKGYAVTGKLPGIPAKVRGGPGAEDTSRTGSVLSRGSLRTAQGVVGQLGGGSVTGQLVRNVAGESLNEVRQDVNERTVTTLELPSGTEFQVVVTD